MSQFRWTESDLLPPDWSIEDLATPKGRRIAADWWEELGEYERAGFLRMRARRLAQFQLGIGPTWKGIYEIVDKVSSPLSPYRFVFVCHTLEFGRLHLLPRIRQLLDQRGLLVETMTDQDPYSLKCGFSVVVFTLLEHLDAVATHYGASDNIYYDHFQDSNKTPSGA